MAIEIERRFLVRDHRAAIAAARRAEWTDIRQGYFGHIDGLKLRVRSSCDSHGVRSALLTRKGPRQGCCREEWESPVDFGAAEQALASLPLAQVIRKRRYRIPFRGSVWSLDRFFGLNAGLIIAEIELSSPGQWFGRPPWIGEEITSDRRYGNSALARVPFGEWVSPFMPTAAKASDAPNHRFQR